MAKNVLVLNDEENSLGELVEGLQAAGYTAYSTTNADDCIDKFDEVGPKALYFSLKTIGVLDSLQVIRMDPEGATVPIIFFGTGKETIKNEKTAKDRGGDGFFKYPVDVPKVVQSCKKAIGPGDPNAPLPDAGGAAEPEPEPVPEPVAEAAPEPEEKTPEETLEGAADALLEKIQEAEAAPEAVPLAEALSQKQEAAAPAPEAAAPAPEAAAPAPEAAAPAPEAAAPVPEAAAPAAEAAAPAPEAAAPLATGADPALLDAAKQRAEELEKELAAMKAQLEQEAQAKATLEEKVAAAAQAEEKLTKELNERTSTLLQKNQAIDELQEASKKALEEFEEKHHEHETESANHHMAIEATVDKQIEEIKNLAEQLKETRSKLTDESSRYKKAEEERRRLEQDQARLSEREKRTLEDQERLKQEKDQAQARADKLADELKEYIQSSKNQLEDELRRRSDDQERWRSGLEERSKLEDQLRDQEQQLLRQENEEATRRLQDEQDRQHTEDDIRRQAEQNVRLQLDQERLYQENQERRRMDALDPNLEPELRENMQSVYGHPAPAQPSFSHSSAMSAPSHSATTPATDPRSPQSQSRGSIETGHGTIQGPNEVAVLFTGIWRKQVSGRVDFHHQDIHKVVYFERGSPVETFSNQRFDKIEDFLYREGKITRAQYQSLRLRNIQGSRRIGALLVAEGQLKPEELFESVRGHIKEVCASVFEWQQATYQFREEEIDEDQKVRLRDDPRSLIIEGIRRKYLLPRLMTVVGPPSTLLKPLADGQLDAELLGLEARERQAVRMLDGTRNIEEIVFSTGLGPLAIYQVMAGLLTLDLVQVLVRGNEGYNLDGSSSADLLDRRRLEDKVEQTRGQDYFTILGVSRQATPYEITQAHKKQIQEYAPTNFSDAVCNQYKRELIEIERVLDDAYDVLQDDSLRLAYARNLPRS